MQTPQEKKQLTALYAKLALLYDTMHKAYVQTAEQAQLSCANCMDNCCKTHFRHHTFIEWAYLWQGLYSLPPIKRQQVLERAKQVADTCLKEEQSGSTAREMCPLNEDGKCILYTHRLMICRLHGTKNSFTLPSGEKRIFVGCSRFATLFHDAAAESTPCLDRTPLYAELAQLEQEYRAITKQRPTKIALSIAEMMCHGEPKKQPYPKHPNHA